MGAVEVSGTVVGPYTLISPLSEADCLYYHAVARSSGEGEEEKKVAEEVLYTPFFLDDGTGRLMVDPRGAEMELRPAVDAEYSPSTGDAFTRHFLVRRGLSALDLRLCRNTASALATTCSCSRPCERIRDSKAGPVTLLTVRKDS